MVSCGVATCSNRTSRKSSQQVNKENEIGKPIKFYSFPKDAFRKEKWLQALVWINKTNWLPLKCTKICAEHFTKESFEFEKGRKVLKKDAYPSIFNAPSAAKPREPLKTISEPILEAACDTGPLLTTPCRPASASTSHPAGINKHRPAILGNKRKAVPALHSQDETVSKKYKLAVNPTCSTLQHSTSSQNLSFAIPSCAVLTTGKPLMPNALSSPGAPFFPAAVSSPAIPSCTHTSSRPDVSSSPSVLLSPTTQSTPTFQDVPASTPQNVSSAAGVTSDAGGGFEKTHPRLMLPSSKQSNLSVSTSPSPPLNTTTTVQDVHASTPQSTPRSGSVNSTAGFASDAGGRFRKTQPRLIMASSMCGYHDAPISPSSSLNTTPILQDVYASTPRSVSINSTDVTFDAGGRFEPTQPQLPTPSTQNSYHSGSSSPSPSLNTPLTFSDSITASASILQLSSSTYDSVQSNQSPVSLENNELNFDTPRKVKLKKEINILKNRNEHLRKKMKLLYQTRRRDKQRIKKLQIIIKNCKKEALLSDEEFASIKNLGKGNEAFILRLIQKAKGVKVDRMYEPALRAFACTLHYYSPRAYNYVRNALNKCLPHVKTIQRWYMGIDGKPGFTTEAMNAVTAKVKASKHPLYAALVIDEMNIRQHVDRNFEGYVDLGVGTEVESKDQELATQAYTFMLVGINGSWKIPVGYFLINSLVHEERAALVLKCLTLLHETKIRVKSLTFDGTKTNIAMAKKLGCDFSLENMVTWFPHPVSREKIFVFLDPCHMLKLVRNTLGDWKRFYDSTGAAVKWQYLEELHKLQKSEGLRLANKISGQHIEFERQKMKVRLAAQLLSMSTAKALTVCTQLGLDDFIGCEPLIQFIKNFDKLFDILNSRSIYAPGFKKAICPGNKDMIFEFFSEMTEYIKGLHLDATDSQGSLLLKSDRNTGFLGFLICMKSAQGMYEDLCEQEGSTLTYLPLYKISQDHVELFFGLIRSRGGWNNNPTARHFTASYKRCLVHLELRNEKTGNCFPLENITILYCTKAAKNPDKLINLSANNSGDEVMAQDVPEEERFQKFSMKKAVEDHFYFISPEELTLFARNVVTYIAGFVVKTLKKSLKCITCLLALTDRPVTKHRLLLDAKDWGGLTVPGEDVVLIAERCEIIVRSVIHKYDTNLISKKNDVFKMTNDLMAQYAGPENNSTVFNQLDEHMFDQDPLSNHKYLLIKSIAMRYFKVRLNHIVREMINKVDSKRHWCNKLILFSGQ